MTRRGACLLLMTWLASAPAAAATCFDGQLPQASGWAETAARAAVRLVAMLPDGRAFANASGMVVAGSGAPNRILTAAHVARTLTERAGATLAVYSSRGRLLGHAALAALAAPGPAFGLAAGLAGGGDAAGLRFGDAAVLAMTTFAPGGAADYAAIPGMPLARTQPRALLEGVFAVPAGVDHGVSGAGVVADGAIVGVMAFKTLDRAMPMIAVTAGDAEAGGLARRTIRLPRTSRGYAQPVTDARLLAGLGEAGRVVGAGRAMQPLDVFVPGFVNNACVGFRGHMQPA